MRVIVIMLMVALLLPSAVVASLVTQDEMTCDDYLEELDEDLKESGGFGTAASDILQTTQDVSEMAVFLFRIIEIRHKYEDVIVPVCATEINPLAIKVFANLGDMVALMIAVTSDIDNLDDYVEAVSDSSGRIIIAMDILNE